MWSARQVFSAHFSADGSATHVEWVVGDSSVADIVLWLDSDAGGYAAGAYGEWIEAGGRTRDGGLKATQADKANAQNALEYIGERIGDTSSALAAGQRFAANLAAYLSGLLVPTRSVAEGAIGSFEDGWWLFTAEGLQPMFVVADGGDVIAQAKSEPRVQEDTDTIQRIEDEPLVQGGDSTGSGSGKRYDKTGMDVAVAMIAVAAVLAAACLMFVMVRRSVRACTLAATDAASKVQTADTVTRKDRYEHGEQLQEHRDKGWPQRFGRCRRGNLHGHADACDCRHGG